ncbi:MAG: hypothetical protein WBF13_02835 [Candidatus Zixiibacteriota bacterium]
MSHKADPPNEGRCGSFFAIGKPRLKAGSVETRLGTKSYNVLQNHRREYGGVVCLKDSDIDESWVFIFRAPFFGRAPEGEDREFHPLRQGDDDGDRERADSCSMREQRTFWPWSLFEQKPLAGIVFATYGFEKTQDWLY